MMLNILLLILLGLSIDFVKSAHFTVTSEVYLEVSHGKEPLGQIVIGLFGDDAPKTVENFRQICINGIDGLSYNGSRFHRVINRFMIQGGDILSGNGEGSISIYGTYFEDENLTINHTARGFIGMANEGPDSNGSQFYITTVQTPWLNGKHTIFGKCIAGQDIVHMIERVKTDTDDIPVQPVIIEACGDNPIEKPYVISDDPYDIYAWIKASTIPLGMSFTILAFFQYVIRKLDKFIK